jgi:hypothetical protein
MPYRKNIAASRVAAPFSTRIDKGFSRRRDCSPKTGRKILLWKFSLAAQIHSPTPKRSSLASPSKSAIVKMKITPDGFMPC